MHNCKRPKISKNIRDNYAQVIKRKETESMDFWSQLLIWPEIVWATNLKRLIYVILSISISSAEAERGFSTMNYIRNDRRSRLTDENLEDIMRIKLNAKDDLDKFIAVKYIKNNDANRKSTKNKHRKWYHMVEEPKPLPRNSL